MAGRSSATAEDRPHTSFAGMNETFLNVRGAENVLRAVRQCWASLYGARVIFYRREQGLTEEGMSIAVAIQRMVNSEKAGVLFTLNPATGDDKRPRDRVLLRPGRCRRQRQRAPGPL